ncbi:hypothetical protein ATANTOWER_028942 [Ataeniobius toweri]|uniref:Uncharacterized protein n=1 Tax=Ataeniobius toweri TaxID=208326 RepID=A0ABU7B5A3_9TELE|nr:hypothetical protein [Ataeniobius toweri]
MLMDVLPAGLNPSPPPAEEKPMGLVRMPASAYLFSWDNREERRLNWHLLVHRHSNLCVSLTIHKEET